MTYTNKEPYIIAYDKIPVPYNPKWVKDVASLEHPNVYKIFQKIHISVQTFSKYLCFAYISILIYKEIKNLMTHSQHVNFCYGNLRVNKFLQMALTHVLELMFILVLGISYLQARELIRDGRECVQPDVFKQPT